VELADERDDRGIRIARLTFGYHDNDRKLVKHATDQMTRILETAGGSDAWRAERTAHLLGGCRMGEDPDDSVVDPDGRAHELPNLWVCDGSVFPTSLAVNPSLTIQAIASRSAERIRDMASRREITL
jgi:choline dehydrogenase-like flavoprotein